VKTAISIPDEVFEQAERYAKKLGVSRSELFTRAVKGFLEQQRAQEITASYDRAFGPDAGGDDNDAIREAALRKPLVQVEW
jgi:hypothetical protein